LSRDRVGVEKKVSKINLKKGKLWIGANFETLLRVLYIYYSELRKKMEGRARQIRSSRSFTAATLHDSSASRNEKRAYPVRPLLASRSFTTSSDGLIVGNVEAEKSTNSVLTDSNRELFPDSPFPNFVVLQMKNIFKI
jgi:hypothetical protein